MVEFQIEQQFGRIGLNIQPSNYNLRIQPAELDLKQTPAQITLEQPAAILDIDYTLVRETLGYRSIESQTRELSEQAKAEYDAGLEREVAEGHKLGHIEKNITIGQIAGEAIAPQEKGLTIQHLPFAKISVTTQSLQWDVQHGGVKSVYHDGDVKVDVLKPWDVSVYWEQKPYIHITSTGWAIDIKG